MSTNIEHNSDAKQEGSGHDDGKTVNVETVKPSSYGWVDVNTISRPSFSVDVDTCSRPSPLFYSVITVPPTSSVNRYPTRREYYSGPTEEEVE